MIYGVGTDITEIKRVLSACEKEHFRNRIFTEQELLEEQRRQEQLEKLYDERSDLQRKLNAAKDNLEHSEKALEQLESNKEQGMEGVDSAISRREFQVKVYTKEVADLEREIWFLDGKIALLE